ncbi:MAG: TIM barrel protein [Propionibacteriaceae bacterium]|nr:TIM barrel protein [Propionibacteriaceae bacterium]
MPSIIAHPLEVRMVPDANLAWLFTEVPWPERFAAAAAAGFVGVEMPWPPLPPGEVAQLLAEHELASVLVNVPVGEGEFAFGWACRPDGEDEFRRSFLAAQEYAELTGTRFIHVLAGLCPPGLDPAEAYATYHENLVWALDQLTTDGPTLVVEAINRRDNPHFLLAGLADAARLVRSIESPRLRLLFDTFHCGVELLGAGGDETEAEVAATVATLFAEVSDIAGHIQLGDAPGRTEPGSGEIDFDEFFTTLRDLDWAGYVGGEYRPLAATQASLGWRGALVAAEAGDLKG